MRGSHWVLDNVLIAIRQLRYAKIYPSRRWNHDHSYADTILMPKTTFPVRTDNNKVQQNYLSVASDDVYAWQKSNLPEESLFVLHDGPPYANADVHLGHSVNRIIKDMIVRYQVMRGRRVSYIPGWDCHGLPIELKVLEQVGKGKGGRDRVAKLKPTEVRAMAREHAQSTIANHMRNFREWATMGEWDNPYKTMNPQYEIRQLGVFKEMLKAGLIYRRVRPVFWSCESYTALAEAELEYTDAHESTSVYVKFRLEATDALLKLVGSNELVHALIWTTTPWTIPSNKAIAVNPEMTYCIVNNSEYGNLLIAEARKDILEQELGAEFTLVAQSIPGGILTSQKYTHPLLNGSSPKPVLSADFVTPDSGTGLVHLAPGHGMEDYLLCMKHGIDPYSPVNDYGKFDATVPAGLEALTGKAVLKEGQSKVIEFLTDSDALVAVKKYVHKYPYDWRSKKPVIIRSTAQWFADVDSIKEDALAGLKMVDFLPEAGRHRLSSFTSARSEWCISRQRSWGVPIPALFDAETGDALLTERNVEHIIEEIEKVGVDRWFEEEPDVAHWIAPEYRTDDKVYIKGKDTMDVWFDSGTSWTLIEEKFGAIRKGKPLVDVYMEGSDQHRGWFQSSLLTYTAFHKNGRAPFARVITHGFTLDEQGKKMSKSIGNVIQPSAITTTGLKKLPPIGVSGLRLWVAQAEYTTDIVVSEEVMRRVADALGKLRRTFRYILGNLDGFDGELVAYDELRPADKFALGQLYELERSSVGYYDRYAFNRVIQAVNKHVAELSASYFSTSKDRLYTDKTTSLSRRSAQTVLAHIFKTYSAILSPIIPLLAQEAWHHAPSSVTAGQFSPFVPGWFVAPQQWNDAVLKEEFGVLAKVQDEVKSTMELARKEKKIGSSLEAEVILTAPEDSDSFQLLKKYEYHLPELLVASETNIKNGPVDLSAYKWSFTGNQIEILGANVNVYVVSPSGHKCPRCWQFTAPVEGGLCGRCAEVLL
ncbi:tRNA synthetases class I-domain-containing protein [Lipomyces arxii]|uniref:tRNA synthetases class I-domain-containing protein n=1 Tax=Lipomyces arxii TaxID=56418 RepID=UPI0034CDF9CE